MASLLCKFAATAAFIHLHQRFYPQYTPDYQLIFADACKLADLLTQDTLSFFKILLYAPEKVEDWHLASQPRAFFAVKLYSFLVWITDKNFWLSMLYASFASFLSLWWLVQTLQAVFPKYVKASLISFIFLPSLLFWASATSKESLLIVFLCVLSVIFLEMIYQKITWWRVLVFLLVASWLSLLKYYYAFGFLLSFCLYWYLIFIRKMNLWAKIAVSGITMGLGLLLTLLHPNLNLNHFTEALYNNYQLIILASPRSSVVELNINPTWQSLLLNSPLGLGIGLFAPLPHQVSKWQMLPIALENAVILLLGMYVVWQIIRIFIQNKPLKLSYEAKDGFLLLGVFVFVVVMATFLGLSSPNFGALSRYRTGFSPFLVYVFLILLQYLKKQVP